jgi:hypothetical protein
LKHAVGISITKARHAVIAHMGSKSIRPKSDPSCLHDTWTKVSQALGGSIFGRKLTSVDSVSPAPESAVFFIPALLFIRLALRTTMAVNAVDIVTLRLVVYFPQLATDIQRRKQD